MEFHHSNSDVSLWFMKNEVILLFLIYVGDMLVIGNNYYIQDIIAKLKSMLALKDLGDT